MEHRTLLLCVSRFMKKLTSSHQHVSFLVNVYYKKGARCHHSVDCLLILH